MPQPIDSKSLAGPSEICMLMPIKKGFTEGLATRTYESRLRSFAKLFSDLRAVARESRLSRPYSDIVDRLRTIHGVTISIVGDQLLLAVHFDRPWEPYIRVIWKDLGHIFDLILCNCEGYVEHHRNNLGFEAFAGWIRKYQVETNTFYLNSNHTVDDVIYLDQLERRVRTDHPGPSELARLAIEGPQKQAAEQRNGLSGSDYVDYLKLGVQAVAAFHALTFLYPKETSDHNYLLRAARSVLPPCEFPPRASWKLTPDVKRALTTLKTVFRTELDWFENFEERNIRKPPTVLPQPFVADNVQGGILSSYGANVGCLALLQVQDAARARRFLDAFSSQISWGRDVPKADIFRNIGFTAGGLERLGLPAAELDKLPPAFREGMANRAGLIGDLRHNHPDQWSLPVRNWPPGAADAPAQTVNLEAVDVVIQLRRKAPTKADRTGDDAELMQELARIAAEAKGGLLLLSVQNMYSQGKPGAPVEHFGFRDGISNPKVDESNPGGRDVVPAGDIFLGVPNSRKDRLAAHWSEPLFKEGTFQVIRKLSQDVPGLYDAVTGNLPNPGKLSKASRRGKRDALLAKMMGRTLAGIPLVKKPGKVGENDFDFNGDPDGARCPLFAHIRRVNPRDAGGDPCDRKGFIPRLLRRGMSYGAPYKEGETSAADRGLIFQAYNASLAEQFEVLQRWVSGDNRTAPYSRLSDPFLGVPEHGVDRVYRFANGKELNLGDKPFVRLLWGLYLFAPSRIGLGVITRTGPGVPERDWTAEGLATIDRLRALEAQDKRAAFAAWKRLLEEKEALDDELHRGVWQAVREVHHGVLRTPFGVLVGDAALVDRVLTTPASFSVAAYQERLERCVGENYLGMDPPLHDQKAKAANDLFYSVKKEDAFDAALLKAGQLLGGLGQIGGQATIPLPKFADQLLAEVSKHWFGVPDGTTLLEELLQGKKQNPKAAVQAGGEAPWDNLDAAHCPFHVISSSRFVFQPQPSDPVDETATQQGQNLKRAMDEFVAPYLKNPTKWPTPLLGSLYTVLLKQGLQNDFAEVLLGALLGYMPTVQGNFLFTTRDWLREGDFWRVQNAYLAARRAGAGPLEAALEEIEPRLERAMARRPIPAMIHRRATRNLKLGDVDVKAGEMVVVGLVSATAASGFSDVAPAFGGDYGAVPKPTHACPGRKLGTGTLLGMIASLFELPGTLRRAPSTSALLYDSPPPP